MDLVFDMKLVSASKPAGSCGSMDLFLVVRGLILRIARDALIHSLDPGEFYVADGGYKEQFGYSDTPTGLHRLCDRTKALARARHETVNGRFKVFGALKQIYRHDLKLHSLVFRSIANITQVSLRTQSPLFSIDYNEREMLAFDNSLLA